MFSKLCRIFALGLILVVAVLTFFYLRAHYTSKSFVNHWPPHDFVKVERATCASLDKLAPGSAAAQDRQEKAVAQLGLPLEIESFESGIVFRLIPAGSFLMGSSDRYSKEETQSKHLVTISQPFYCGKFEITQSQWKRVMGQKHPLFDKSNRWYRSGDIGDDFPMDELKWDECQEFLKRLCRLEKVPQGTYRLLTEAEWEYACRAGTQTDYCFGNWGVDYSSADHHPLAGFGNCDYLRSTNMSFRLDDQQQQLEWEVHSKLEQVGQFKPNAWGLYDMHGNLYELCSDLYDPDYYKQSPVTDPKGSSFGSQPVVRGGCYQTSVSECRSAARQEMHGWSGLRIARIAPLNPDAPKTNFQAGPQNGQPWFCDLRSGIAMMFVPVSPGSFVTDIYDKDYNVTKGRITISRPFWMASTEVTQRQYQQIMGQNPSEFQGLDNPVERVSWKNAMTFCQRLTRQDIESGRLPKGYEYTLPSAAQWEYACRAGETNNFSSPAQRHGWYKDSLYWNTVRGPQPVGQLRPNPWGLYDMHGNVYEFCLDRVQGFFGWSRLFRDGDVDPIGRSGLNGLSKGGDWNSLAEDCNASSSANLCAEKDGVVLDIGTVDHGFKNTGFRPIVSAVVAE